MVSKLETKERVDIGIEPQFTAKSRVIEAQRKRTVRSTEEIDGQKHRGNRGLET